MLSYKHISRAWSRACLVVAASAAMAACIYDDDHRCGPNMELSVVEACNCVAGYVREGSVCVHCPDHETEKHGACVCDVGYQRTTEGAVCSVIPSAGLGAACSESEPCRDEDFSYCAEASNGDRYCTRAGCSAPTDCADGYACSGTGPSAYCRRSPVGMASACTSAQDCAGTEATYCETLLSHSCLVEGCSLAENDCFTGWECCDASSYDVPLPICIPEGKCPK